MRNTQYTAHLKLWGPDRTTAPCTAVLVRGAHNIPQYQRYVRVRAASGAHAVRAYQRRLFKVNPSDAKCRGSGTEIISGKHSDTRINNFRIKPLPLTNGHGRCIAVTPERTLLSVGKWPLHITVIYF
jgi:hypothetical protein